MALSTDNAELSWFWIEEIDDTTFCNELDREAAAAEDEIELCAICTELSSLDRDDSAELIDEEAEEAEELDDEEADDREDESNELTDEEIELSAESAELSAAEIEEMDETSAELTLVEDEDVVVVVVVVAVVR